MSGTSATPRLMLNWRRTSTSQGIREITLSVRTEVVQQRSGLLLVDRQSVLDHLANVVASLDQFLVAVVTAISVLWKQGRKMELTIHNARNVV